MGGGLSKEHASINDDECNKRYQSILQNFIVEKKCSDKILGNITVYLYKKQDKVFRLAELTNYFPNEASMEQAFQTYYKVMESSPSNLLQLHMCRQAVEDSLCSLSFKIYTLFDYISGTLEDKIQERAKIKQYFREEELWSLLEQLVSVLSFMQKHEYLRTDTIFVLYKLFYRSVLNIKSNYEDCQRGIVTGRYLPHEGLKHLKEQSPTYTDYEQQDKFGLGMVMLSAALLENLDQCYDYPNFELKNTILHEKLVQMKQSYSHDFCLIVQQLLTSDESGFSIEQLNQNLSSFQLPCGPRIQDSYQNIKLESLPPVLDNIGGAQTIIQGNNSIVPIQNNNIVGTTNVLNQSLNNGVIQGNYAGVNEVQHHQDQNQQIFNNSPKNNIQNGSQQYGTTGTFNQYSQLQLQHQHTLSNPEGNMHNNLINSIIHNQGLNPPQNNNIFNAPLANTISLNNQPSQGGMINQFQGGGNNLYNPNPNGITHSPNLAGMNGNLQNFNGNNNYYPQLQVNNNMIPLQNNMPQNMGISNQLNGVDQNTILVQLLLQVSQQLQQQQQQQQQLQESFYQNTSQMTYSPLKGANIFNQFNQKKQFYNDNQSEHNKSYSALNGIPRRKTTFQYEDGSFYEGEMVLEYRDGYGKLVFSNKGVYEGTWKMNKMHGKGTLYYPNGDIAYEGDWFEDQFNNLGHLYNAKAQHTKQKFDFKDFTVIKNYWLKYEGEFCLDRKQGFGTLYFTNGERYSGNFKNDTVHGYGVYHQLEGDSFSGYWEDNILIKRM